MPLKIEQRPAGAVRHWPTAGRFSRSGTIVVGLINNMPDSALEATESQFTVLLEAAAGEISIVLRCSSLPEVPRGTAARERIEAHYWPLDELLGSAPDALIVTGTEPKTPALSDEPYWHRLVDLIEYADAHTVSSVWSCLAAHAAVLHLDGIPRRRLPEKLFGVFDQEIHNTHALIRGLQGTVRTPHSRWNDLPIDALRDTGYKVLSESTDAGADAFVKERRSLFVFFQGHPEYEARTLLKEFQRDVGRFISGENRQYPNLPAGYFDAGARDALAAFERRLKAGEFADPRSAFPLATVVASLANDWRDSAVQTYRNWLNEIESLKRS